MWINKGGVGKVSSLQHPCTVSAWKGLLALHVLPPSAYLRLSTVWVCDTLSPLVPVPCYSITGIYLSCIISAAPLCVASPSHLCILHLAPPPYPSLLFPPMILICILPIPLNRLWLCNVLTSHLFGAFVNANAGKKLLSTPFLAQHLCSLSSGPKIFLKRLSMGESNEGRRSQGRHFQLICLNTSFSPSYSVQ